jgi:hypothetical protein
MHRDIVVADAFDASFFQERAQTFFLLASMRVRIAIEVNGTDSALGHELLDHRHRVSLP